MIPTLEPLGGSLLKIYFSGRDDRNRSQIGWVILDLDRPEAIVDLSAEPVLTQGELGCFDDNGVTPSCLVRADDGKVLLYYIGWNPGSTVRLHLFGGLAVSDDDGRTFHRHSRAPLLERSAVNPLMNTAPFVIRDGATWRMFYVAGVGWRHRDLPRYHIQTATSSDGFTWQREGRVAVDFEDENENALARPFVLRDGGVFKMWFAAKGGADGGAYRMSYAESGDGETWVRDDAFATLPAGPQDYDREMVEYFAVHMHRGQKFLFYNGNDYGREGICLAVQR